MEAFFIIVALALAIGGIVIIVRGGVGIGIVVLVFALVVFLLRDTLTAESKQIDNGTPAVVTIN
jgi:hypothetical protein